ncbi:hypothetical protein [Acidaminococcus intestini]|jgi:hypothetical protein|uniref:hypothetical protein n=1 Tax=Acidaminococcus intestini TaxID=187327 RepID=UPI0020702370|nr:hypothetical protein [Acidaminococcus intestini]DAP59564.1 MAG TPA: hypothetical protein [Caudoviricetes sp.]
MEKEMTREQIAYDAKDLFAGGWRASDRDEFKKEYGLTDWEADVMQEELEKLADQYVEDSDGHMIYYDAAVEMMDDDLREELHREMAPCTNQEFYDAYVKAHAAKYNGEKFQI